ncbi:MAG: rifampicin phosphotransferase [Pseudonocardiales bacterium]|nr:rifampicin phosphotransferase [Pseudonocardiales bacterium]
MSQDPLNQVGGARTFWTTVNATEAIPGATTPLTWSFYSDATELALRGTFAEIGTLSRSEVTGANVPADPDGRFIGIFFGHPAANMNVFRRMADLTPGGSGDALEEQFFGTKRSNIAPIRSRRRYPVVAARMPVAAWRAPGRIRAGHDEADAWWREVVSAPVTPELARELLPAAADRYRAVLHWHGVGTMFTQGLFDQLTRLAAGAGRPGAELELVGGLDDLAESAVLDDLWAVSRGRLSLAEVVRRHGCHGRNAGELSTRSWREDPDQARAAVEQYRGRLDELSPRGAVDLSADRAAAARAEFLAGLRPVTRAKARLLLRLVRRFMPLREVGRGGLLRALDAGRLAARCLGAELHRAGALADPADVFFLTIPELVGPLPADVGQLVALRRKQHAEYALLELPDAWLGTPEPRTADVSTGTGTAGTGTADTGASLSGVAASPGSATGTARVVDDPDEVDLEPGEILVCHTTDPSWASLMSLAAGLVIDVGGPLSHGAIVARELGVPCVIGTRNGTRVIRTGDTVQVDGSTGVVHLPDTGRTT